MRSKGARVRIAGLAWVLYLALAVATLLLQFAIDPTLFLPNVFNALVLFAFATVGALIASRRPENPVGWLMCLGTLLWAAGVLALQYAIYALVTLPGVLPGGEWMGVLGASLRGVGFGVLLTYVLLYFPTGHLPSAHWRAALWFSIVAQVLFVLAVLLWPSVGVDSLISFIASPLNLRIAPGTLEIMGRVALIGALASMVVCGVSVLTRFRRSKEVERQQLKWFAAAALVGVLTVAFIEVISFFNIDPQMLNSALFSLAVIGFPLAIGIAILRYRLFDIDVIIRRTLTYAFVTAVLLVVFFGSVIVLQQLFAGLTGSGQNEIVTVLSTLAIAALFVPVRNWVQNAIDRRFNRKRYNAEQVLSDFANTVRDETDLEKLTARLMQVVDETMQPKSVSVWLKKDKEKQSHRQTVQ